MCHESGGIERFEQVVDAWSENGSSGRLAKLVLSRLQRLKFLLEQSGPETITAYDVLYSEKFSAAAQHADWYHSAFYQAPRKSSTELYTEPMQTPTSVETGVVHPVTYRWTSGCKTTSRAHRNLSVTCPQDDDPRCRRKSWNGAAARGGDYDDDCDIPRRPRTTRAASSVTSPTRVRFIYEDEDAKARVCGNVQRLLNVVQQDPEAVSTNAQVARKVLKYRRVMGRLDDVNVEDPDFDASAFFGIEWCRIGAPSS